MFASRPTRVRLAALLLAGLAPVAAADWARPSPEALAELDASVEDYLEESNTPGAVVAVASRGELLDVRTYGLADVELAVPVTATSRFEIGSISKQFVAAAALLLAREGRLDLDAPIHSWLPELPGEWLGVTLRQLLNHTSGIPDYELIESYDVYRFRLTPEEVIRIAHSRPMDFEPGTGWFYSNTGYYIASMIVERAAGRPLGEVLKTRIFEPIGMTSTRLADPEAIIENRASGYWENAAGALINRMPTETSSTLGAGGLLSSAADLAKWDAALYGDELLNEDEKALMFTRARIEDGSETEYGLGWFIRDYEGRPAHGHSGQVAGFNAYFGRLPGEELAVIVFLNRYRVRAFVLADAALRTWLTDLGLEHPED